MSGRLLMIWASFTKVGPNSSTTIRILSQRVDSKTGFSFLDQLILLFSLTKFRKVEFTTISSNPYLINMEMISLTLPMFRNVCLSMIWLVLQRRRKCTKIPYSFLGGYLKNVMQRQVSRGFAQSFHSPLLSFPAEFA